MGGSAGSITGGAASKLLFAGGIGKESSRHEGGAGSEKLGNDNLQGGSVSNFFVVGEIGKTQERSGSDKLDGGDGQPKLQGGCTNGGAVG